DGLLRIEVTDQLVDDDGRIGRVQPVATETVGDHRERVGHVGIGYLAPAGRHRQHDVERLEVLCGLRLHADVLLLEEVGDGAGGGGHDRRRCGHGYGRYGGGGGAQARGGLDGGRGRRRGDGRRGQLAGRNGCALGDGDRLRHRRRCGQGRLREG